MQACAKAPNTASAALTDTKSRGLSPAKLEVLRPLSGRRVAASYLQPWRARRPASWIAPRDRHRLKPAPPSSVCAWLSSVATSVSDPSVSRRRRVGLRLEPAYCAPIHVVGRGDVPATIAFRQTRASALLSLRHHSMVDRRRHAAGNALPLHQGFWSVHEARVPSTSSSVGNRPVAFFE